MATLPTMDVYYSQGPAEYEKQKARYYYEIGSKDPSETAFIDPTYGRLDYSNISKPGTLEYKLYNPQQQATAESTIKQVTDLFTQNVGFAPTQVTNGDPMWTITQSAKMGKSAEQIVRELGGWETWQKFGQTGANAQGSWGTGASNTSTTPALKPSGMTTTDFAQAYKAQYGVAPTNEQLLAFTQSRQAGLTLPNIVQQMPPSKPAGAITPESTKPATTTNLQGTVNLGQDVGALPQAMVTGANTDITQIMKSLTPATTPEEQKQQSLLDQMTSLIGENANKAADQLTAEQSAGLPQLRQQFADINASILSKSAEYDVLQQANLNKPITMNRIIGAERAILNAKAADIGLLQARALGLQGKIEDAQNTVNRAIDLKYSAIQAKLDIYQAQLNAIQPILNKQEKQQALAQQVLLDRQKQALADQKEKESTIQKTYLQAVSDGIKDTKVLDAIKNAGSVMDAMSIYGANKPAETNQQIIGTAETGYKLVTYGKDGITNISNVMGGTGGGGGGADLTKDQAKNLSEYFGVLSGLPSRDEALKTLEKYKGQAILDTGEAGYQKMIAEVDRLFPPAPTSTTTTAPVSQIEKDIQQLSASGILSTGDIRTSLRKSGYSDKEITSSSVGQLLSKVSSSVGSVIDSIYNSLFK